MIDAEKLLGKVLAGALQGNVRKGRKRRRSSDDLVGSLLGGLTSGKGLITAIGLGVGAYEILKQSSGASTGVAVGGSPHSVSPAMTGASSMPPPIPPLGTTPSIPPPVPGAPHVPESAGDQNLAMGLIRIMIAAAHADGQLDEEEERRILEKLQGQGLSREERQFMLQELHAPRPVEELAAGVDSPMVAQTMYSLAVSTIVIDTADERQWLDRLASALSLSPTMQRFIEQDAG